MNKLFAAILIGATTMSLTGVATAATAEAKASYKASNETADAEYKVAREKCNALSGNPKDVCTKEAEAIRTHTRADAKSLYKNTAHARTDARNAIASAEYDVAKAKCGSKTGNEKDVCIKEAKAVYVAAKADAKADKKVAEARADARDDKSKANYKVAIEKCDSLAGAEKDTCVTSTKKKFGE